MPNEVTIDFHVVLGVKNTADLLMDQAGTWRVTSCVVEEQMFFIFHFYSEKIQLTYMNRYPNLVGYLIATGVSLQTTHKDLYFWFLVRITKILFLLCLHCLALACLRKPSGANVSIRAQHGLSFVTTAKASMLLEGKHF